RRVGRNGLSSGSKCETESLCISHPQKSVCDLAHKEGACGLGASLDQDLPSEAARAFWTRLMGQVGDEFLLPINAYWPALIVRFQKIPNLKACSLEFGRMQII